MSGSKPVVTGSRRIVSQMQRKSQAVKQAKRGYAGKVAQIRHISIPWDKTRNHRDHSKPQQIENQGQT